ncbi:hypothetical protein ACI6Q2_21045 [Chitinophagaceae bacterium LWZ2-11]
MLVVKGHRQVRIKKYCDNGMKCSSCGAWGIDIKVYRNYFHIFLLPMGPSSAKFTSMRCHKCSEPVRIESVEKEYAMETKTPIYFYSGIILIVSLICYAAFADYRDKEIRVRLIETPKIGDVYRIKHVEKSTTTYYFLRVSQVAGDSVSTLHNTLQYGGYVAKLNDDDFFEKTIELVFTKNELKDMLDKGEITSVERDYGNAEGFNRIK